MRKFSPHKVMKKTVIGITVVGKDREGIVATFTNFAFSKGGNIEKVNQNVIKGLFGMYLEASFSKTVNVEKFDTKKYCIASNKRTTLS
jgi:formyltetrahydrofolate deformylase